MLTEMILHPAIGIRAVFRRAKGRRHPVDQNELITDSGMSGRYGSVSKTQKHTEEIHTEHSTRFEKPAIGACRIVSERQSIVAIPFDGRRFIHYSDYTIFAFIYLLFAIRALRRALPTLRMGFRAGEGDPVKPIVFPK